MKTRVPITIITCPKWDAKPAKQPPVLCPKSVRIIFHHTAGHHPEISGPSTESHQEAEQYARDIQRYHMVDNGWNDSGHNFLVCRNGDILQGRWYTVTAIQNGHMVISAHCPGQNNQIGIEHEHIDGENLTNLQKQSSGRLMAWIAGQYGLANILPVAPHRRFFATECPGDAGKSMIEITQIAETILKKELV